MRDLLASLDEKTDDIYFMGHKLTDMSRGDLMKAVAILGRLHRSEMEATYQARMETVDMMRTAIAVRSA